MQRLTARLLLLVLFAGTLAPFAAASAPMQHEHCERKPLAGRTESTPSCHHHAAAQSTQEPATSGPTSNDSFQSSSCCTGHECCRPLARALWAQLRLQASFQQTGQTTDRILAFRPSVRILEFATYRPARAPPAL